MTNKTREQFYRQDEGNVHSHQKDPPEGSGWMPLNVQLLPMTNGLRDSLRAQGQTHWQPLNLIVWWHRVVWAEEEKAP